MSSVTWLRGERGRRALVLAMAAGTLVIGLRSGSRAAAGADAYGYISQAYLWIDGDLRVEQPWVDDVPWPNAHWTFSPLGYRPVGEPGDRAIVPTYCRGCRCSWRPHSASGVMPRSSPSCP
jgi:hypothetical protein